jgi:ribonucleotide monophosphatase NagD (HAD superfamily)
VLAIGDSFRTDIAGANGAGVGSLFIAGGVHADDFTRDADGMPEVAELAAAAAEHDAHADFVLPRLAW